MAAEEDRDRRGQRRPGQLAQPRDRAIRSGEQQVGGEAVLRRPASAVRRHPVGGPGGPGCRRSRRRPAGRDARRATPGRRVRAARRGARPARSARLAARAARRARRLGEPARRPKAALLDERPHPRRGGALQPGQGGRRGPAAHQQLRPAVGRDGPDGRHAGRDRTKVDALGAGSIAEQDELERPVDVDRQPPAAPEVADLVAGHLLEPARAARCRRAGRAGRRAPRRGRSRRRRPSSGCWRAPPVARRRPRRRTRRDPRAWPAGSRPIRAPRARPVARHGPARGAASPNDRSSGGPRRSRRPPRRPAVNAAPMPLGERGPAGGDPARDRAGLGPRLRVHDADADRSHAGESIRRPARSHDRTTSPRLRGPRGEPR